jgi:peptidoglycan/xylan/chitin deacetylase (PgdA/CDA1 family)
MGKLVAAAAAITAVWAAPAAADTTVSLTFDDGLADAMPAVEMLDEHGMEGTFYIIPARVGRPNSQYVNWSQVQSIYNAGNEIGGHTRNHVHLDQVNESTARTEICGGRDDLLARGYPQVSFAYPFGDHDATSEELVQECGYLSGRGVGGLRGNQEPNADTIPPRDPWVLPTPGSIDVEDTLPDIKEWIEDAEAVDAGNGSTDAWIPLVFHHMCDPSATDCLNSPAEDQYITPSDFDALLDWLEDRESDGTHVKTVAEVMTGQPPQDTTPPVSQIRCDGATCQIGFYNHSVSAALSATDVGGSGLKEIRYTRDDTNPTPSSPLYTGPITVSSTDTIRFRAWDNADNAEAVKSQTIQIDTARPTSTIQCNSTACSSGFYNAPVSATLSASDNSGGSGVKNIRYTTNGNDPTGSSPIYSGPINLSSTTTIKFRAEDNAGNVESPVNSQTIEITSSEPPPPPPPPGGGTPGSSGSSSGAALGAFASSKSLPNGTAKLTLGVSGPGELEAVDGKVAGAEAAAATGGGARIKPTSKFVSQAGEATLVIKPSKAGKRALRRKGKLAVQVRVTFTPVGGSAMEQTVKVKLKLKARG